MTDGISFAEHSTRCAIDSLPFLISYKVTLSFKLVLFIPMRSEQFSTMLEHHDHVAMTTDISLTKPLEFVNLTLLSE
jgi:hypothetical protein